MSADCMGRPLTAYPDRTDLGTLVGIGPYGHATFVDGSVSATAVLDPAGSLRAPPRTDHLAHQFPYEDLGFGLPEFVGHVANEFGPWRSLSESCRDALESEGVDQGAYLHARSDAASVEDALEAVLEADGWAERAGQLGDLRVGAMDRPGVCADELDRIFGIVEAGAADLGGATGSDSNEAPARDASFHLIASLTDCAVVVRRVVAIEALDVAEPVSRTARVVGRSSIDGGSSVFDRTLLDVLDLLGRRDVERAREALLAGIEAPDPEESSRTINAVSHLQRRPVSDDHPLLAGGTLSAAIRDRPTSDERVAQAVADFELVYSL